MLLGVIGVFRSLMVQPSVGSSKVLCVLVARDHDLCKSAKSCLQSALSCPTAVTGMVHFFDYNVDYQPSPEFHFFCQCKEVLSHHPLYNNVSSMMGIVTEGPFTGSCAIGCGSNKLLRQRATYLSLAFTLLARFNEPRFSTFMFKTPEWNAHYEHAARTLGADSVEPWIRYCEFDDVPSEGLEELVSSSYHVL